MKSLILVSLIFFSFNAMCQKTDYLIKTNGDTIRGSVKLQNKIFYVQGSEIIEVKAVDVKLVKSEKYKGNFVVPCKLVLYSDNIDDYDQDYVRREYVDTVMILDEIIATPKINLYYGVSNFKVPFYFYKTPTDSLPVQLVIRYFLQGGLTSYGNDPVKYGVGQRAEKNIVEDKGYVNQLYAIMGNCKKISSGTWEVLSYRGFSFKEVIKKFNKCK